MPCYIQLVIMNSFCIPGALVTPGTPGELRPSVPGVLAFQLGIGLRLPGGCV